MRNEFDGPSIPGGQITKELIRMPRVTNVSALDVMTRPRRPVRGAEPARPRVLENLAPLTDRAALGATNRHRAALDPGVAEGLCRCSLRRGCGLDGVERLALLLADGSSFRRRCASSTCPIAATISEPPHASPHPDSAS